MGDGKRADFGLPLLGGLGDGDDCLINGLFRTVPILHLPRPGWSRDEVTVDVNDVRHEGIAYGNGVWVSRKIQESHVNINTGLNFESRPRENGANQSGTRVQDQTQSKEKLNIMSANS